MDIQPFNFKNVYSLNIVLGISFMGFGVYIWSKYAGRPYSQLTSMILFFTGLAISAMTFYKWWQKEELVIDKLKAENDLLGKDKEKKDIEIDTLKAQMEKIITELAEKEQVQIPGLGKASVTEEEKDIIRDRINRRK